MMSNDFMYFSKILLNPGVSGLSDISSFEITTTWQETYYYYTHLTVDEAKRSML